MSKTPRITELCAVTWRVWLDDLCAPPRDPYGDNKIGDRRFAKDARNYIGELERELAKLRQMVAQQAEDDGLWFSAATAPEAYLQQELRKLHAAVEETK